MASRVPAGNSDLREKEEQLGQKMRGKTRKEGAGVGCLKAGQGRVGERERRGHRACVREPRTWRAGAGGHFPVDFCQAEAKMQIVFPGFLSIG